jgi:hypothetical protein
VRREESPDEVYVTFFDCIHENVINRDPGSNENINNCHMTILGSDT